MVIRQVTAAHARSMRSGVPERHVDDEAPGALHLGAFEGDALVGVVSGVPGGPEGQIDGRWLRVIGPFGEHGDALVSALADAHGQGWLWSPEAATGLERSGNRWQRRAGGYSAEDIVVLEKVEAIRKRPGMYVGSRGPRGVTQVVWELVSNTVDEHLAGHARNLWVQPGPVGITVSDDGRGIPVEAAPDLLERLCAEIAASSARGGPRRHVHVGLHGLGLPVVNALASAMVVTVDRGRRYQQAFAAGRALGPLVEVGPAPRRGTSVWFVPDVGILEADTVDPDEVHRVLGELAVLNPSLAIHLDGAMLPSHGGLLGYARHLAGEVTRGEWSTRGSSEGVSVEVAVCWGSGPTVTRGWANQLRSVGSHVDGLLAGLRGTDAEGRVALVAVALDELQFVGRTRSELAVPLVEGVVRSVVAAGLGQRR